MKKGEDQRKEEKRKRNINMGSTGSPVIFMVRFIRLRMTASEANFFFKYFSPVALELLFQLFFSSTVNLLPTNLYKGRSE